MSNEIKRGYCYLTEKEYRLIHKLVGNCCSNIHWCGTRQAFIVESHEFGTDYASEMNQLYQLLEKFRTIITPEDHTLTVSNPIKKYI
jgi:hypothetical protein